MHPEDYPLYRSQTAVLAAILRLVSRDGYLWHHLQTAPEERILVALGKLHEKHLVLMDRRARHLRREAGLPLAQVVLGPEPRGGVWPLALLSDRRLEGEPMRRVTDPRSPLQWVAWRGDTWKPTYELHRDERGRWTWKLTEAFHRELLEEALHHAHRGDWPRLVGHLKPMGNLPMFRGVWLQLQDIRRRVQALWGDRHLRDPEGQWKAPPWRKALEEWPKTPLSPIGMRLFVEEGEDRPRTLGEWLERRGA